MTSFDEMTNTFTIKDLLIQSNHKMNKHSVTNDKNINGISLMNKGQIQQSSNIKISWIHSQYAKRKAQPSIGASEAVRKNCYFKHHMNCSINSR